MGKKVVFCHGHFQPLTSSQHRLINRALAEAQDTELLIFLTPDSADSDNPLPFETRATTLKQFFPEATVVEHDSFKTVYHAAKYLSDEGYKDIRVVVPSEAKKRVYEAFSELVKHPLKEDFDPEINFEFESLCVCDGGTQKITEEEMRGFVAEDDFQSFLKGYPQTNISDVRKMFNAMKRNIFEDRSLDILTEEESYTIKEGLYDEGKFKAVFLAGGSASGKDFILKKIALGMGLVELNSDIPFEHLLRKNGLSLNMPPEEMNVRDLVRGKAKVTSKNKEALAIYNRNGVIINGTGADYSKYAKQKNELESIGYSTCMVYVNTSNEVSRQRNAKRARVVPEPIRQEKWNEAQENIGKFQNLFGGNFRVVDNSTDIRSASPEEKKHIEDSWLRVWKFLRKFVASPTRNQQVQQWISGQQQIRGMSDYSEPKGRYGSRRHQMESLSTLASHGWPEVHGIGTLMRKLDPSKDHFYAKALKDYEKGVDKISRGEATSNRTVQKLAANVANSYDLDYRKFLAFLKKMNKKGIIDKKYVIDDLEDKYGTVDYGTPEYKQLIEELNDTPKEVLEYLSKSPNKIISKLSKNRMILNGL